jgi:tyrosyl-tRNA synthetase
VDRAERLRGIVRGTEETLTLEELERLLDRGTPPRAYIGFEPSGRLTVGHLVCIRKMRDLQEAGVELTVFLADWHAWINDKLGGSLDRIRAAGEYMRAAFTAFGVDPERARYRWAHELVERADYWARVIQVAKATSLSRTKRAMTILGRSEEEAQIDTAKLLYPAMQVADIFELPVEIAYAGADQRRAHVLAREVAHRYGWPVPVALHTPIIPSLKGSGRMDATANPAQGKMSKSDPTGAISIPATGEEIDARIRSAFCPAREVDGNPVLALARHVLLPWSGRLSVARAPAHGGPVEFDTPAALLSAWTEGKLHPADLKAAVSRALSEIVEGPSQTLAAASAALG